MTEFDRLLDRNAKQQQLYLCEKDGILVEGYNTLKPLASIDIT
jgi:hypothetical protein